MDTDRISRLEEEVRSLRERLDKCEPTNSLAIVCFSGEWDKLFAAFTIANGALALGLEVHIFFTFWGATAVRNGRSPVGEGADALQRAFSGILPGAASSAPLSRFHFFGLGKFFLRRLMKKKGVDDLPALIRSAKDLGLHAHYCDTSLQLFGWCPEDLLDANDSDCCGVSTFLSIANRSRTVFFI